MRLLVLATIGLAVLSGCDPTSFSCEGLNAAQSTDAARTCVFAARTGEDGFETSGDEPETFLLGGVPLTPADRLEVTGTDQAKDGTSLTSLRDVVTWKRGGEILRSDSVGPVGGVAMAPSGRWAMDISRGALWIGEPDGRRSLELQGGEMRPVGTVASTGEPALWIPNPVYLAFSPDERSLARVEDDADDTLTVWDAVSGARLWSAPVGGEPRVLAYSPDGALLAVGTLDAVTLWDAATGTPRVTWTVSSRVEALTFDGDHLVTWFASKQTKMRLPPGVQAHPSDHYVGQNTGGYTEVLRTSPSAVAVWRLP